AGRRARRSHGPARTGEDRHRRAVVVLGRPRNGGRIDGGGHLLRRTARARATGAEWRRFGVDDPRALMILAAVVGCQEPLPPLAEALMIVDTDAAVPHAVNRLRVDLYRDDGVWFDSRDIAQPDPRDWPVSFSVFSDDETTERSVWVRLRAYPEGRVRDYLGERFRPWGGA